MRTEIWLGLPEILLESVAPTSQPGMPPSSWTNLLQRMDVLAVAGVLLCGAWGSGHLWLRLLRLWDLFDAPTRTAMAFALGLASLSLLTLACGVIGLLERWLLGGPIVGCAVVEIGLRLIRLSRRSEGPPPPRAAHDRRPAARRYPLLTVACLAAVAPFLLAMLLGAMLPPTDFDVKEYHLQGPKEYYLQGQIAFLPHNVYTSFPFLTEMLALLAMVVRGDWYRGALAGQVVLMCFAPLTALAIYAAGRRWFHPAVGWLGVLVHLTVPWTYRISVIAYAEGGLTCYLFATLLAVLWLSDRRADESAGANRNETLSLACLAGLLAGSAAACKYPGVLSVAAPLGVAVVLVAATQRPLWPGHIWRVSAVFGAGVLLMFGPWLAKNVSETGNPVYPLLYSVFGGIDWNPETDARWRAAHSPPVHLLREPAQILIDLRERFVDVIARSDWQSPLLFGCAPLAWGWVDRRRLVAALAVYVAWLFLSWWGLTHRIDRFWVPLLPVASLLAGAGLGWLARASRTRVGGTVHLGLIGLVAAVTLFHLGFITTRLCGYNAYLVDLDLARRQAATPSIALLNAQQLPAEARVLFVGEAQVFDAQFDHVYNTVFDQSWFQRWTSADRSLPDDEQPLRAATDILATLQQHAITHVFVNWQEIVRYREPGSYGFTEYVQPERFARLVVAGVLEPVPLDPAHAWQAWMSLSDTARGELERWGRTLRRPMAGGEAVVRYEFFAVADGPVGNGAHEGDAAATAAPTSSRRTAD
jgi:hypothetical protein